MIARRLSTADDRRVDVTAAALSAFALRGYFGTNTTEIAAVAGISQAYLYRLYSNKEALFIAVLTEVKTRIRQDLESVFRSEHSAEAMEAALLDRPVQGDEEAAFLLQAVAACSIPEIAGAVRACFTDQWSYLRGLGIADQTIRDYLARSQLSTAVRLAALDPGAAVTRALGGR